MIEILVNLGQDGNLGQTGKDRYFEISADIKVNQDLGVLANTAILILTTIFNIDLNVQYHKKRLLKLSKKYWPWLI